MNAPPPWTLTGHGLILVAHFPEAFVRRHGFLRPYQQVAYRGWLGTVMLVNYQTSNVGPYAELLFIPGLFRLGHTTSFSITKIYVSTEESVVNGRLNWGIPKERADFAFSEQANGHQQISVSHKGQPFLSVQAKTWGPRFRISTAFMPGFRVVQASLTRASEPTTSGLLLTKPRASGSARLATLTDVTIDSTFFPDLSAIKPILTLSVENFRMQFPHPRQIQA
ncbi:hypothetical protein GGR92_000811 [Spirosoma lacussanchae]|uniref:acetoacetate decarboxylase family protein n=1 Tax=Spirosoma lacussanchae TaxID=1884249 RepID=UPI00110968CE|nr:acetoacetate decarboxylase family protein [Spirosoma lacussanchae]